MDHIQPCVAAQQNYVHSTNVGGGRPDNKTVAYLEPSSRFMVEVRNSLKTYVRIIIFKN